MLGCIMVRLGYMADISFVALMSIAVFLVVLVLVYITQLVSLTATCVVLLLPYDTLCITDCSLYKYNIEI